MKTIILDLDNTIYNTAKAMIDLCREVYPENNIPEFNEFTLDWHFSNYNLPKSYWKHFGDERLYTKDNIMEGCVESINKIRRLGWEVIICTKSNLGNDMKLKFLQENIPNDGVIFCATNGFDIKSRIQADIIIDDRLDALQNGERDFRLLFGDYEWNSDSFVSMQKEMHNLSRIIRVKNWEEVYKFISSLK